MNRYAIITIKTRDEMEYEMAPNAIKVFDLSTTWVVGVNDLEKQMKLISKCFTNETYLEACKIISEYKWNSIKLRLNDSINWVFDNDVKVGLKLIETEEKLEEIRERLKNSYMLLRR